MAGLCDKAIRKTSGRSGSVLASVGQEEDIESLRGTQADGTCHLATSTTGQSSDPRLSFGAEPQWFAIGINGSAKTGCTTFCQLYLLITDYQNWFWCRTKQEPVKSRRVAPKGSEEVRNPVTRRQPGCRSGKVSAIMWPPPDLRWLA